MNAQEHWITHLNDTPLPGPLKVTYTTIEPGEDPKPDPLPDPEPGFEEVDPSPIWDVLEVPAPSDFVALPTNRDALSLLPDTEAVDISSVGLFPDGNGVVRVPDGFTYDRRDHGGKLICSEHRMVIGSNVSINGLWVDRVDAGSNHAIAADAGSTSSTLSHVWVEGGSGNAAIGASKDRGHGFVLRHFVVNRFAGDGTKQFDNGVIRDGIIIIDGPVTGKHYDGTQSTGKRGWVLARMVYYMLPTDQVNSAVFAQRHPGDGTESSGVLNDIAVFSPNSWYPIRLHGPEMAAADLVGFGPTSDKLRRGALVLNEGQGGIVWSSVHSLFDDPVRLSKLYV